MNITPSQIEYIFSNFSKDEFFLKYKRVAMIRQLRFSRFVSFDENF